MTKKTAILVIHGIGEQKPFETLDAFVRPLSKGYSALANVPVKLKHDLLWFDNWGESCLSLIPESENFQQVDVMEYYWSHLTQRSITPSEIIEWVFKVSQGAKSFYDPQKKNTPPIEERNNVLFQQDGEFDNFEYLVRLLSLGGSLKHVLYSFAIKLVDVVPVLKSLRKVVSAIFDFLKPFVCQKLVDYIGDIALYCTTDAKSEYFQVRKTILDGAVEKAKWLMMNDSYDTVIICGHSLGSVITYDVIDRLNILMANEHDLRSKSSKLKGMVTFGSPLDKIAFFFDEHINRVEQPLRYAIVSHLHGFRRRNVDDTLPTSIKCHFGKIPWLNFWTSADIISGHLDVYKDVTNIEIDFSGKYKGKSLAGIKLFIHSHGFYWESSQMFDHILRILVLPVSGQQNVLKWISLPANAVKPTRGGLLCL